jgi:hypothetical protein
MPEAQPPMQEKIIAILLNLVLTVFIAEPLCPGFTIK